MIEINHVSKQFGSVKVLEDINIHIKPSTIHGIVGENGAGKTTLLQMLVGIYDVEQGSITIDGQDVYNNNKVKEQIAYVADRNQFFENYKVKDMVRFYAYAYPNFAMEEFERYNSQFQISLNKKVSQLSKGMQMRLAFMLGLATKPKIMVLDEPTSGLDAAAKKVLIDFLIEAVEMNGMTVVLTTHHLGEIERLCDEITLIHKGKIMEQLTLDQLKQKVRKLQVSFKEPIKGVEDWPEFVHIEKVGRIYYLITTEYSEELERKIYEQGATCIEEIGMNLEEMFVHIYTKEKENGDEA